MARLSGLFTVFAVCIVGLLLTGCGKKEEPSPAQSSESSAASAPTAAPTAAPAPESPPQTPALAQGATSPQGTVPVVPVQPPTQADLDQMAAQKAAVLKAMNQGKDVEPISLDALKGFLPATLAGMKRGEGDARQMGMAGIKVAVAQADYEAGAGTGTLDLMMMDLGNVSGPMRAGMTGWAMVEVDHQTDTGYEKTVTYQGYKGMEKYDNQTKHGELRIIVADRFVVEVTGDDVTMETIKQAMGEIDVKKLAEAAK